MATTGGNAARLGLEEFERLYESVKNWGRWGEDDQRGTLNFITEEHVRAAAALVRSGRSVSLSLDWNTVAGPDNPKPAEHRMTALYGAGPGGGPLGFAMDFVGMEMHGDAHSHIDALCHVAYRGLLYNGVSAASVTERGGARGGMEVAQRGIVGRGVLLDIPRLRGVKWLEPGELIPRQELEAAEAAQGVRLGEGDILLLRSGHHRRRLDEGPWDAANAKAGLHPSAMPWLRERRVAALGADGDGDAAPSPVDGVPTPIHALGMNAMGMHFMDSLQFEELAAACEEESRWAFLLVIAPLRIPHATGSPVNPIAVF